jgi:hypothetical protein
MLVDEFVIAERIGVRGNCDAGTHIFKRHLAVRHNGPGGVVNRAQDSGRFKLAEKTTNAQREDNGEQTDDPRTIHKDSP